MSDDLAVTHPMGRFVRRYNTDLRRWEFWSMGARWWTPSMHQYPALMPPTRTLSYDDTWAEPVNDA